MPTSAPSDFPGPPSNASIPNLLAKFSSSSPLTPRPPPPSFSSTLPFISSSSLSSSLSSSSSSSSSFLLGPSSSSLPLESTTVMKSSSPHSGSEDEGDEEMSKLGLGLGSEDTLTASAPGLTNSSLDSKSLITGGNVKSSHSPISSGSSSSTMSTSISGSSISPQMTPSFSSSLADQVNRPDTRRSLSRTLKWEAMIVPPSMLFPLSTHSSSAPSSTPLAESVFHLWLRLGTSNPEHKRKKKTDSPSTTSLSSSISSGGLINQPLRSSLPPTSPLTLSSPLPTGTGGSMTVGGQGSSVGPPGSTLLSGGTTTGSLSPGSSSVVGSTSTLTTTSSLTLEVKNSSGLPIANNNTTNQYPSPDLNNNNQSKDTSVLTETEKSSPEKDSLEGLQLDKMAYRLIVQKNREREDDVTTAAAGRCVSNAEWRTVVVPLREAVLCDIVRGILQHPTTKRVYPSLEPKLHSEAQFPNTATATESITLELIEITPTTRVCFREKLFLHALLDPPVGSFDTKMQVRKDGLLPPQVGRPELASSLSSSSSSSDSEFVPNQGLPNKNNNPSQPSLSLPQQSSMNPPFLPSPSLSSLSTSNLPPLQQIKTTSSPSSLSTPSAISPQIQQTLTALGGWQLVNSSLSSSSSAVAAVAAAAAAAATAQDPRNKQTFPLGIKEKLLAMQAGGAIPPGVYPNMPLTPNSSSSVTNPFPFNSTSSTSSVPPSSSLGSLGTGPGMPRGPTGTPLSSSSLTSSLSNPLCNQWRDIIQTLPPKMVRQLYSLTQSYLRGQLGGALPKINSYFEQSMRRNDFISFVRQAVIHVYQLCKQFSLHPSTVASPDGTTIDHYMRLLNCYELLNQSQATDTSVPITLPQTSGLRPQANFSPLPLTTSSTPTFPLTSPPSFSHPSSLPGNLNGLPNLLPHSQQAQIPVLSDPTARKRTRRDQEDEYVGDSEGDLDGEDLAPDTPTSKRRRGRKAGGRGGATGAGGRGKRKKGTTPKLKKEKPDKKVKFGTNKMPGSGVGVGNNVPGRGPEMLGGIPPTTTTPKGVNKPGKQSLQRGARKQLPATPTTVSPQRPDQSLNNGPLPKPRPLTNASGEPVPEANIVQMLLQLQQPPAPDLSKVLSGKKPLPLSSLPNTFNPNLPNPLLSGNPSHEILSSSILPPLSSSTPSTLPTSTSYPPLSSTSSIFPYSSSFPVHMQTTSSLMNNSNSHFSGLNHDNSNLPPQRVFTSQGTPVGMFPKSVSSQMPIPTLNRQESNDSLPDIKLESLPSPIDTSLSLPPLPSSSLPPPLLSPHSLPPLIPSDTPVSSLHDDQHTEDEDDELDAGGENSVNDGKGRTNGIFHLCVYSPKSPDKGGRDNVDQLQQIIESKRKGEPILNVMDNQESFWKNIYLLHKGLTFDERRDKLYLLILPCYPPDSTWYHSLQFSTLELLRNSPEGKVGNVIVTEGVHTTVSSQPCVRFDVWGACGGDRRLLAFTTLAIDLQTSSIVSNVTSSSDPNLLFTNQRRLCVYRRKGFGNRLEGLFFSQPIVSGDLSSASGKRVARKLTDTNKKKKP